MQAVTEALKMYRDETDATAMRVWGYRNVWFRFMPWEANQLIPVSLNSIAVLNVAFMNCYLSQREASFPSYDYDGPFSNLSQRIWINQYQMIKTCLGNDFFLTHPHPRMRAAKGMIFLNEMTLDEFFSKSDELRKTTESV
jgi:glucosamine-6-phosphate deaminase